MKLLKLLSALAILNLLAVSVISNIPSPKAELTPSAVLAVSVTPTPRIVVKKIVTKVYRTTAPKAPDAVKTQTVTTNQSPQNSNSNPSVVSPPSPVTSNRCIIVIDGGQYDVTDFRNRHSGGNIFTCGSDMSQIFWSRHNAAILSRMQQYKI